MHLSPYVLQLNNQKIIVGFHWGEKLSKTQPASCKCIANVYFLCPTANIYRATNIRIFQIVLSIQNIITRIPGQVERQQPVYMIDALGRHAPFYLEFIRSKEVIVVLLESFLYLRFPLRLFKLYSNSTSKKYHPERGRSTTENLSS
jgi:hypothetical protein